MYSVLYCPCLYYSTGFCTSQLFCTKFCAFVYLHIVQRSVLPMSVL
nr:MAG TPA: hypothetical protein [Caudoviricetes sp.]